MSTIKHASEIGISKFEAGDEEALKHFVQEGYVLYQGVYDPNVIKDSRDFFLSRYRHLEELSSKGTFEVDVNGWAVAIIDLFAKTELFDRFISCKSVSKIMSQYLGPDICALGYDALWINVPKDTDPVLLKGLHVDAWTGTSINTIFAKTFFTDVDRYNGMSVCPGSHLQGLIPVRNRVIDPAANVEFDSVNLDIAKAGDFLIWHSLLVHSTTGHSDKNIRVSITSRFASQESTFSSQERALGYRPICVGPMNQVLRLIGNDLLLPFRTYGGYVGIDRRLADIYPHSDYKKIVDYKKYLD